MSYENLLSGYWHLLSPQPAVLTLSYGITDEESQCCRRLCVFTLSVQRRFVFYMLCRDLHYKVFTCYELWRWTAWWGSGWCLQSLDVLLVCDFLYRYSPEVRIVGESKWSLYEWLLSVSVPGLPHLSLGSSSPVSLNSTSRFTTFSLTQPQHIYFISLIDTVYFQFTLSKHLTAIYGAFCVHTERLAQIHH